MTGAVNGSSHGTVSLGAAAPYNGCPSYSINTDKAERLGFRFSHIDDWVYDLLDHYIERVRSY